MLLNASLASVKSRRLVYAVSLVVNLDRALPRKNVCCSRGTGGSQIFHVKQLASKKQHGVKEVVR